MDSISLLRLQLQLAHGTMESTMADVTQEQADWLPAGVATPLGASYAHVVVSEDLVVNAMLRQQPPIMMADQWAGNIGMSEMMPLPGPDWGNYAGWTRSVKVDPAVMQAYAQVVYAATDQYLSDLKPEDLDRVMDLSAAGLGERSLGWALSMLVIGHINNLTGEISCLKGCQGAKGYPF